MLIEDIILGVGKTILQVMAVSWWVILPVGLFFIWNEFWLWGKNRIFRKNMKWMIVEIKIPRNIEKTPKAMESVFSALHAIRFKTPDFEDKYFRGEESMWFTCELVGYAGGVHFFIRFPAAARNLVESAIYSEYPDAEIVESDDYTKLMPDVLPNDIYDLWGQDFVLAKEDAYPIRTYEFFEESVSERRLDPISAITEAMSRLKEGEAAWIQYLLRPVSDSWKKEGEAIRDKIMQRKKEEKKGFIQEFVEGFIQFLKNLSFAAAEHPIWSSEVKKEEKFKMLHLSPGETNILKGIENKISKSGFESAIRFLYIDKRDSFTSANVSAIGIALRQFNTQDMNSFKSISETMTKVTGRIFTTKGWFRKNKLFYKKRVIYDLYKLRWFPPECSIMNTEELATVFHFPIISVESPLLRRLDTRKGEPPANLPIK